MKKFTILILLCTSFSLCAMPKAVLFDCDGVLVDSEYVKFKAWNEALRVENIELTLEEYMTVVGASSEAIAKSIMKNKHCKFNAAKVINYKNLLYTKANLKGVTPIPYAVKYINGLLSEKDKLNVKVAVVSSDSRENILRNLKFAGIKTGLLDGVFSGHDDLHHIKDPEDKNKPKPYIYQLAAEKLQILPKDIVVFEDTNAGVVSASLAGMKVIAVPNIFTQKHDFSKALLVTTFNKFQIEDLKAY